MLIQKRKINKPQFLVCLMEIKQKEIQQLKKKSEDYAKEQGFKLNPDDRIVKGVIKGLLMNKKLKGELYCPCRRVTGNKEEDMKIPLKLKKESSKKENDFEIDIPLIVSAN